LSTQSQDIPSFPSLTPPEGTLPPTSLRPLTLVDAPLPLSMSTSLVQSAHLELLKCTRADAGAYAITLENSLGTATGTVNVKVIEPPAVDFDDSVKKGVMIKAGESLRLPAVVTGRPQPEVKWAKDEADIDKERMIVETVGKNSTLFIKKAVRADHGKYKISGTNSSGTKTNITVEVLELEFSLNKVKVLIDKGFWNQRILAFCYPLSSFFLFMFFYLSSFSVLSSVI
uniref:Ig-like domain-containing protein n=1 Tax=Seriola lalandi dorsalis TaxID=1841481 RepID=A0A3B4WQ95_SERLL